MIDHSAYKMASQPEDLEDHFEFESDDDSELQDLEPFNLSSPMVNEAFVSRGNKRSLSDNLEADNRSHRGDQVFRYSDPEER